jgi:cytochrome c oxidase subunit II
LADTQNNPLLQPLPDGVVPAVEVARTEKRWLVAMVSLLIVMMAAVVISGAMGAIHPPSNVERIDPAKLHLKGEFAESNLGTAQERDGSLTARLVAEQYARVPECVKLAVDTPVKFRLTRLVSRHWR